MRHETLANRRKKEKDLKSILTSNLFFIRLLVPRELIAVSQVPILLSDPSKDTSGRLRNGME